MQFTGTQLVTKRNFFSQNNNFGVSCSMSVNNPTGEYRLGVSGSNNFEIVLKSGQILKDGLFLHSYAPFEPFDLEFQFNNHSYNFYKNNRPIVLGGGKESGDYNYFYISRENSNINAEFDVFVSGSQLPNYTISEVGYWLDSGQSEVTGAFVNNSSYGITIFDSAAQTPGTIRFDKLVGAVTPGSTGYFKYTGSATQFLAADLGEPIFTSFTTNFNQATVNFRIIDARAVESFVFLQPLSNFTFDQNNQIGKTLFYNNYSGGALSNAFNANLVFSLEYVSGTGFFSDTVGTYTTTGYGTFVESGLITGIATTITGNILVSSSGWATGEAGGTFQGVGTGLATGVGYTGLASGIFTGFLTGTIYDGSGKLLVGYPALGQGVGESISLPVGTFATGAFYPTHYSPSVMFSWNSGQTTRPQVVAFIGSGTPTFSQSTTVGTLRWSSGQDILWGLSGMNPIFGITGWMTGNYIFLFSTGTSGTDTNNLQFLSAGNDVYPGAETYNGTKYFTGATATTVATGYIDVSNPIFVGSSNNAIRLIGYQGHRLDMVYYPANNIQKNVFVKNSPVEYFGFYRSAEAFASGLNKFEDMFVTGVASGNTVYLYAKENGEWGNSININYNLSSSQTPQNSYIGITGSPFLTGGSISSQATGYVQIGTINDIRNRIQTFSPSTSDSIRVMGAVRISTGSVVWRASRYSASAGNFQNEINYNGSVNTLIQMFQDSPVSDFWMDMELYDNSGIFLRAKDIGPTGNVSYYRLGASLTGRRSLTGGGVTDFNLPVIPVGEYTGSLINTYISGSGTYSNVIEETGSVTTKTFTGQWDVLTGLSPSQLFSTKNINITDTLISTTGDFPPNSQMYFRIDHDPIFSVDEAIFRISGEKVINPFSQTLIQ